MARTQVRQHARAIAALAIVAWGTRCSHAEDEARRRQEAWDQQVVADKARSAVVIRAGEAPRQVLGAPLSFGQELVADISVVSTVTIRGTGGPTMTRNSNLHARLSIHARPPVDPRPPLAFEITELTGDLRELDKLPRTGVIEPGAHGEPWMAVLDGPASGEQGLVWERDVKGWLRRVLLPLPPEPLGRGAAWRRGWDDYLGYDKITEIHDYVLAGVTDGVAQIEATATSHASSAAGSGGSKATATITLPVGRRTVPTAEWVEQGTAQITERGQLTELTTTATTRIRPHVPR